VTYFDGTVVTFLGGHNLANRIQYCLRGVSGRRENFEDVQLSIFEINAIGKSASRIDGDAHDNDGSNRSAEIRRDVVGS
jgi:hypothetical protein